MKLKPLYIKKYTKKNSCNKISKESLLLRTLENKPQKETIHKGRQIANKHKKLGAELHKKKRCKSQNIILHLSN